MSWYDRVSGTSALGSMTTLTPVFDLSGGGDLCAGLPRRCPTGEHAICDTPRPEYLDGVLVTPPRQWVCIPDDPLEMVPPPGAPACPSGRPMRAVTSSTGEKGPWACANYCTNGRAATLTTDLRWQCPAGSAPKAATPAAAAQVVAEGTAQGVVDNIAGDRPVPWKWIAAGVGITVLGTVAGYLYWRKR